MYTFTRSPGVLLTMAAAAMLVLGACASPDGSDSEAGGTSTSLPEAYTKLPATAAVDDCGPASATTVTDGFLTVATDDPAYEPWFVDNDPSNGKGFEGAVARAVSAKLGYRADQVQFTRIGFNEALTPGEKNFDFDINQFTIVDSRRDAVDFSSPYYAVAQSVVALADNPAAQATSLADLVPLRLGAQKDSTSLSAITDTIQPEQTPSVYDTTDEAKAALEDGRIDALVVDIPTGFQITSEQIEGSVIVGQFPRPNEVTEFFGLVLEKNSALTPCASAAVDALFAEGTLDELAGEWLTDTAGARILD